jgi:hypothetical protein
VRSQHKVSRRNLPQGMPLNGGMTREMERVKEAGPDPLLRYKYGPPRSLASYGNLRKDHVKARITLAKVWK